MAKEKKEVSGIRCFIKQEKRKYEYLIDSTPWKNYYHAVYMMRQIHWYYLFKEICPPSDKSIQNMTHEEKRLQEWKMWKYVKHIVNSLTWQDYEKHLRQFATILGKDSSGTDRLIIDDTEPSAIYIGKDGFKKYFEEMESFRKSFNQ